MPYMPACNSIICLGVKNGSKVISCGTIPIDFFADRGCVSMSYPLIATDPIDLTTNPAMMLIQVDFPAPFGPSKANIDPCGIFKSILSNANFSGDFFVPAYVFERFFISIAFVMIYPSDALFNLSLIASPIPFLGISMTAIDFAFAMSSRRR